MSEKESAHRGNVLTLHQPIKNDSQSQIDVGSALVLKLIRQYYHASVLTAIRNLE